MRSMALSGALVLAACAPAKTYSVAEVCGDGGSPEWGNARPLMVFSADGGDYEGDVEEPEVRDINGNGHVYLFFNDHPKDGNKDLFVARGDFADGDFVVQGRLQGAGAQTPAVDASPTFAEGGLFAFVSTRTYPNPTETIHFATLTVGGVPWMPSIITDVRRADGLSRADQPWATQGVQLSGDGAMLFFDEAKFDTGVPSQSIIRAARRSGATYVRLDDAELATLLGNVNHPTFLQYGETISMDGLELYFTRAWVDPSQLSKAVMCVMRSTRADTASPFGLPEHVAATRPAPGVVMEAPSLSPDGKTLYYHRKEPGGVARAMVIFRP